MIPNRVPSFLLLVSAVLVAFGGTLWWHAVEAENGSVLPAALTASEPLIGRPFLIDLGPGDRSNPAVAYNSGRREFLVANEIGGGFSALKLLTAQGNLAWDPPLVVLFSGERPALAYNSTVDQFLLVWQENSGSGYDIKGMRLGNDGHTAIGNAFNISTRAWDQKNPAVAFNNHPSYGDFLVVWEDIDPSWVPQHWYIYAQRVAGTSGGGTGGGELIGGNFAAATTDYNTEPDVAYNLNMNEYLVVYTREPIGGGATDVYARRVTRDGVLLTETAIDTTANDQRNPSVAALHLNQSTPYLVAYTDYWNDTAGDVRARMVNKQGQWQWQVNIAATNGREEVMPDVASSEQLGGYTAVWSQIDNDWDIYARRLHDDGTVEDAFNISVFGLTSVPCHEQVPVVAGGSPVALAVWQDNCLGATGSWNIVGRLLGYQVNLPLILRHFP